MSSTLPAAPSQPWPAASRQLSARGPQATVARPRSTATASSGTSRSARRVGDSRVIGRSDRIIGRSTAAQHRGNPQSYRGRRRRAPASLDRMAEELAKIGDVDLCFETFGSRADPALLLVMGLGTQMIAWPEGFCRRLADRGFFVIRYDNRDTGRSTHMRQFAPPTIRQLLLRDKSAARYSLAEMAADGVGLLDHLGIERAHLVGASMGGMIAQTIAARRPERVLSLVSIMSNTGSRLSGQPAISTYRLFLRPMARDRDAYVRQAAELFEHIGSRGFDTDDAAFREQLGAMHDRGHSPGSASRQLAAILASGNRTAELRHITAPTLVIHGTADRLIRPSGGRATARAIPGAHLLTIEGMGHDLPRAAWPQIIDAIVENAARARAPEAAVASAARS